MRRRQRGDGLAFVLLAGLDGSGSNCGLGLGAQVRGADPQRVGGLSEGEQLVIGATQCGGHGVGVGPLGGPVGGDELVGGVGVLADEHPVEMLGIDEAVHAYAGQAPSHPDARRRHRVGVVGGEARGGVDARHVRRRSRVTAAVGGTSALQVLHDLGGGAGGVSLPRTQGRHADDHAGKLRLARRSPKGSAGRYRRPFRSSNVVAGAEIRRSRGRRPAKGKASAITERRRAAAPYGGEVTSGLHLALAQGANVSRQPSVVGRDDFGGIDQSRSDRF